MVLKRRTAGLLAGMVFAGVAMLASCGGGVRAGVYLRTPPPPPLAEARGRAPGPGFAWIAGYYRWDGHGYVWAPGRWERPPRGRHRWVRGRWRHNRHGWYWEEGRWH